MGIVNQALKILIRISYLRSQRGAFLHGFIKKTQKTPPDDVALAHRRNRKFEK